MVDENDAVADNNNKTNNINTTKQQQHFVKDNNNNNEEEEGTVMVTEKKVVVEMIDITSLIEAAAKQLSVTNPMLYNKEGGFNLQDSMAALEIMDKKMDCCEIPLSQVKPPPPKTNEIIISSSSKNDDDDIMVFPRPPPIGLLNDVIEPMPWTELTLENATFIALECMVRLESLLSGASVVESTFTCLYAHKPVMVDMKSQLFEGGDDDVVVVVSSSAESSSSSPSNNLTDKLQAVQMNNPPNNKRQQQQQQQQQQRKNNIGGNLPQQIVYACTLMLLELTDIIRSIILNADIYEEEDFTVSTYNIDIFNDRNETTAINAISDVLEHLSSSAGDGAGLVNEGDHDQNNHQREYVRALELILGYQLDFATACTSLAKLSGTNVRDVLEDSQKVIRVAASKLEILVEMLGPMIENQSDSTKALIRKTFDSNVNRPLVGNAPVRKVVFKEMKESISLLVTITKEIDWALCGVMLKGNSLGRIHRMLRHVSVSSVNILSRSLLVLNLYFDDKLFGLHPLIEMIVIHMKELSHVPDNIFLNTCSQAFLNRLAKPIYDILKVLILNRNRQRTYIEAVMLHDWATLRQEAHIVDLTCSKEIGSSTTNITSTTATTTTIEQQQQQQPHFSLYILYITIGLMDHYVNLGIELKLFHSEDDLAVAYWYRDFLLSSLISQVSTMRRAKLAAKQAAILKAESAAAAAASTKQHPHQKGKKKGSKHKHKGGSSSNGSNNNHILPPPPPSAEELEYDIEFLLLNLERTLCRGLVRFLAAIKQAGFTKTKEFEFTSPQRIFEKRFEAFAPIQQPPPLQYSDYVQGSDFSKVSQHDLIHSTSECFVASKALVDKLISQVSSVGGSLQPKKGPSSSSSPETSGLCYLPIRQDELNKLAKVCIGNSVYVQKLKQKVGSNDAVSTTAATTKIIMDLDTHHLFCTIKIN